MVDVYLSDIDDRLPALSTVFWALFSGFGWLYLSLLKLNVNEQFDYLTLLGRASRSSYWDIGYGHGPWIWLWFRPLTMGVTGLFIFLYLLRRDDLNRSNLLILVSFTILSLGMNHFSELFFSVMSLLMLCLTFPNTKLRLKEVLLGSLVGLLLLGVLSFIYSLFGINLVFSMIHLGLLIIVSILTILILHFKIYFSRSHFLNVGMNKYAYYVIVGFAVFWCTTLIYWIANAGSFDISQVSSIQGVPWTLYPALLGVCGLFSFPGIYFLLNYYRKHPVIIFLVIFIFGIIYGRLLTYINVNLVSVNYVERRIIPLTFSASVIIASLSFSKLFKWIKRLKSRDFLTMFLLSSIVVAGLTSTALSIEYQVLITSRTKLTPNELDDIQHLREMDSRSYLLTYSSRSLFVSEYSPFAWIIKNFRYHLWPAESPELVLNALSSTGHSSVIYLTEEDIKQLSDASYSNGYILRHLLKIIPQPYEHIYYLPTLAPPAEKSNVVLLLPEDASDDTYLYAFDIMSLAGYNYTTAYIYDLQTLNYAHTLVVTSEDIVLKILKFKEALGLPIRRIIVINLDGHYSKLANIIYPLVNISLTSAHFGKVFLYNEEDSHATTYILDSLFTPFSLKATAYNNSWIFRDDNMSDAWNCFAGITGGSIGIPKLSDDPHLKAFGDNSLRIEVSSGNYSQWGISHVFENALNVEEYDFLSFFWYGRGDGTKYVVTIYNTMPSNYFWYEFTDNWIGWRKVILPMHASDGYYVLNGVKLAKAVKGNATWSDVRRIDFKLSGANLNIGGVFHIDRFGFEKSIIANLTVEIYGDLQNLELLSFNGSNYVTIAHFKENETVSLNNYYLTDGIPVASVLGEHLGGLSLVKIAEKLFKAQIWIKMPPISSHGNLSQAYFALNPVFSTENASSIELEEYSINLPVSVPVIHILSKANVVASYDTGTFFALKIFHNKTEINYLNFYPIIELLKNGSKELYFVLGNLTKAVVGNLSSYIFKEEDINAGSTMAFREAKMQGNITVTSESLILPVEKAINMTITANDKIIFMSQDILYLSSIGFSDVILSANFAEVRNGKGYYINIIASNVTLTFKGYSTKLVTYYRNGSFNVISSELVTVRANTAELFARRPVVKVSGKGLFKSSYTYRQLNMLIRALGEDCEINGYFTFEGIYGDVYSIVKCFEYRGRVKLSKPLYGYNEIKSFVEMLPYLFITAISYFVFVILEFLRRRDLYE